MRRLNSLGGKGPWLFAAPWIAWAAVRALGLDLGHPLVALMSLTPYVAATSWLPFMVAAARLDRRAALASGAAMLVLAALVLPRAMGEPSTGYGERIVVMTSNLYVGRADPRAVLAIADREGVDVLSLQELTESARAGLRRAGLERRFPVVVGPRTGESGVFARRGLRNDVRVLAVHPPPPISRSAARTWTATLDGLPSARGRVLHVIAGDFNATLDQRAFRRVLDRGYEDAAAATGNGLKPTWPVGRLRPPVTIDHVLADERLGIARSAVHEVRGSDHRAIVAELILP
ncbi:MAG: Integral membrane protein [uncultured Solirubrobacteraceae bacterium]|uniref:Integral membrane protein n=1 Tax=uncultured Solirubrobacteraceae bacterium TaxID=1162706 RepID=A0A6J4TF87_9ACTN|nr:MAG: Integral membrane protein [uncultured Solirubrobacteraceae bacterium]